MDPVFKPFRVRFDGIDADQHMLEVQRFGRSISGLGRILNSSVEFLIRGEPPQRIGRQDVLFYFKSAEERCLVVELASFFAPGQTNLLFQIAKETLASLGSDAIQRLINISILTPSARTNELDEEKERLYGLLERMQENQAIVQHLNLAAMIRREDQFFELISQFANKNERAAKETVSPLGPTAGNLKITKDLEEEGLEIDLPTAQSIRSNANIDIGEIQEFRCIIDGIIAHKREGIFYILPDRENAVRGDIVDQQGYEFPNIYNESVSSRILRITAKPTYKNGRLFRLTVMDAQVESTL